MSLSKLRALASFFLLAVTAGPAAAQVTSLGVTDAGAARSGSLSAVAYDDKHDVALQVWEDNGTITARFIGFNGVPAGDAFVVSGSLTNASAPRVGYSQGASDDAFLVIGQTSGANAWAQFVTFTGAGPTGGQLVGSRFTLAGRGTGDVLFHALTHRWWVSTASSGGLAFVQLFDPLGTEVQPALSSNQFGTSLTRGRFSWDWRQNRVLMTADRSVFFNCIPPTGGSTVQVIGWTIDGNTAETMGDFSSWLPSRHRDNTSVFLPDAGTHVVLATRIVGPCSFSFTYSISESNRTTTSSVIDRPGMNTLTPDAAYSAGCRCVLVAAEGRDDQSSSAAQYLVGAVLDEHGAPSAAGFRLGAATTTNGSLRPAVGATRDGQFVVSYITGGAAMLERFAAPPASVPGRRFSNPTAYIDGPARGGTVTSGFQLNGWAADFAAAMNDGTGIDSVHVWAVPSASGPPVLLGIVASFSDRADIGATFGTRFARTGFSLSTPPLPAGAYTVVAYAHSAVSDAFTAAPPVTVTVLNGPSMMLDAPGPGTMLPARFSVSGWAFDAAAGSSTSGVDGVHVWAFPETGQSPVFLGAAQAGLMRSDVAAAFGSQYLHSGFRLDNALLSPGRYRIWAYAHSAISATFNNSATTDVTILTPRPYMAVDAPGAGSASVPFDVAGWAIDAGAITAPGVDSVHVWAFPTDGTPAIFLGAVTYGSARPDVGAIFGAGFTPSGFRLTVTGLAANRTYDIVVFAHSSVSDSFNQSTVVRVTIAP